MNFANLSFPFKIKKEIYKYFNFIAILTQRNSTRILKTIENTHFMEMILKFKIKLILQNTFLTVIDTYFM